MKTLLKFIIFISLTILITNLLSYINMWHAGAKNKPPSFCYVAIKQNPLISFVPYNENIKSTNDKSNYFNDSIIVKKGINIWKSVKSGNQIIVSWNNGDVESFFKYRIEDNIIEAISCKYMQPSFGFRAIFYTFIVYLFILVMTTIYKYFRE